MMCTLNGEWGCSGARDSCWGALEDYVLRALVGNRPVGPPDNGEAGAEAGGGGGSAAGASAVWVRDSETLTRLFYQSCIVFYVVQY